MTDSTDHLVSTPSSVRSVKRPRANLSPDSDSINISSMGGGDRVEMTQAQLTSTLSDLLDQKLSTLATRKDLLEISSKVSTLSEENKVLKEEVRSLKRIERLVSDKLLDLEARSRRNNLIFKGLNFTQQTKDFRQVVKEFCIQVLGMNDSFWVNRAHLLGKGARAIIAHIPDDIDVEYIMARVSTLKGTGYVVHRDFPKEIRVKRSHLAAVRAEINRVTGWRRVPLVFDHLVINGCHFKWEDGTLRAGIEDGGKKLQELLNHDFSEFLTNLKENGPTHRNAPPPRQPSPAVNNTQVTYTKGSDNPTLATVSISSEGAQ